MKSSNGSLVKTNITYGLLVLVPVAVLVLLVAKLIEIMDAAAKSLGLDSMISAGLAGVAALVVSLAACFAIGAAVRTRVGNWTFDRIEERLLKHVPGYEIVGNVLKGFAEDRESYPPALVTLCASGAAVFGFVMEDNGNGTLTVFVPSAPAMTVGSIHVVEQERVALLDSSLGDFTNCISQWGVGSRRVLGGGDD